MWTLFGCFSRIIGQHIDGAGLSRVIDISAIEKTEVVSVMDAHNRAL